MHRPERSLLLIRHGQSEWNAVKRWQGIADSPLTDLGRRQAQAIGRSLASDDDVRVLDRGVERPVAGVGDGDDHRR